MRIQNVNNKNINNLETKSERVKTEFLESFDKINIKKSKEELDDYLKEIRSIGDRLSNTQNFSDVASYKKAIKGYLKSVVDYAYSLDKNSSFWEGNYYTTVKTVNDKLEEMTRDFLYEQKENLDIASKIEEINGLLIDLYL